MSAKRIAFNAALYLRNPGNTYSYFRALGRLPNYAEPRSFNEKIQWRKLFDRNPLFPIFADKLAARDYVSRRAPAVKFPRLLWSGTDPDAIPYDALPERFVIKPSHRSGDVIFVRSKAELDRERIAISSRRWLHLPYGRSRREWANQNLPRRLIVEEILETGPDPAFSRDFRCHVFDGVLVAVLVNLGQISHTGHRFVGKSLVFDRAWNRLPYYHVFDDAPLGTVSEPPEGLEKLVDAAESVGRGLDYVRFDCFLIDRDVYFSELTIYSGSGMNKVDIDAAVAGPQTQPFALFLGNKWTLPEISFRQQLQRGLLGR